MTDKPLLDGFSQVIKLHLRVVQLVFVVTHLTLQLHHLMSSLLQILPQSCHLFISGVYFLHQYM